MRNSSIADRDPCPYRIVEDVGGAFAFGAVGGGIWHFGKGAFQSPKGARIRGAVGNCAARAPVMGGQFAVWGGLFACCDCTVSAMRQKVSTRRDEIGGSSSRRAAGRRARSANNNCRPRRTDVRTGGSVELHRQRGRHRGNPRGPRGSQGHGVRGGRGRGHLGPHRGHGHLDEQLLRSPRDRRGSRRLRPSRERRHRSPHLGRAGDDPRGTLLGTPRDGAVDDGGRRKFGR
ncbi:hypothetical protein ACHAWF_015149, partial [Thalassiosira exigua]